MTDSEHKTSGSSEEKEYVKLRNILKPELCIKCSKLVNLFGLKFLMKIKVY